MAKVVRTDTETGSGDPDEVITVEVYVTAVTHNAAMARAKTTGQPLTAICRELIRRSALLAAQSLDGRPQPDVIARSANRPPGVRAKRIRFTIPRGVHEAHRELIRRSGTSVSRALELGLRHYAQTGNIEGRI